LSANFTHAAHPKGKSIYGISDMVGNIWQVMHARARVVPAAVEVLRQV
jgi:hypothetical protein